MEEEDLGAALSSLRGVSVEGGGAGGRAGGGERSPEYPGPQHSQSIHSVH